MATLHEALYLKWKAQVDREILAKCGMHADDLDDWCYRSDYEDGVTPKRCAARAIRNAKESCGM